MRSEPDTPGDLATRIAVSAVRSYQLVLSPQLGMGCRFEPSCSQYAIQALTQYGLARGGWVALKRLLRCRPLGGSGYDPVP